MEAERQEDRPKAVINDANPSTSTAAEILMSDSDSYNDSGVNDVSNDIFGDVGLIELIELFGESGSEESDYDGFEYISTK